jgi:hypothetical protein
VLAPQGLKRASVGRRGTRATVSSGGPWQLRSPPQSPGGLVQHHTRIASLAPFAPHATSRTREVAKCPNCHQPARKRATARCRTSQSLLWMQHSGSSPKILRPNQPGPGRTEPSSQQASSTPEREMDRAGWGEDATQAMRVRSISSGVPHCREIKTRQCKKFSLLEKQTWQSNRHRQQQVRSSGPLGASDLAAIIVYT